MTRPTSRLGWLLTTGLLLAPAVAAAAEQTETNVNVEDLFEAAEYKSPKGEVLHYRLMKPADYDPAKAYPLVLFLHGAGERGDDNVAQLKHGMKSFASRRQKYPCFVLAPQCPKEKRWVEVDWGRSEHRQPAEPSETMQLVLALISQLKKDYSLDVRRFYVTGLSMGGYGTWDLLQRSPNMWAAGVPICGGGDETQANLLVKTPIWAFHGDQDTAVKPERSRNMIAAIEKAGGKPKYTEYEGVGHNSWDPAYNDDDLYAWMFAQKLGR